MANKKLSELPVVTTLSDSDIILALASGTTSTIDVANLKTLVDSLTQSQKDALALITSTSQGDDTVAEIGGVQITSKSVTSSNPDGDTIVTETQELGDILVTTVTTTKADGSETTVETSVTVNGKDISSVEETTNVDVDNIFAGLNW